MSSLAIAETLPEGRLTSARSASGIAVERAAGERAVSLLDAPALRLVPRERDPSGDDRRTVIETARITPANTIQSARHVRRRAPDAGHGIDWPRPTP